MRMFMEHMEETTEKTSEVGRGSLVTKYTNGIVLTSEDECS